MARLTDGTPTARLTLALDLAAIAAFIGVGLISHDEEPALRVFLRNFVPFSVAWIAAASVFHTYRSPRNAALLKTLVVAIPAGVVIRVLLVRDVTLTDTLTFIAVALLFATMFVGLGRVIASLLADRVFGWRA